MSAITFWAVAACGGDVTELAKPASQPVAPSPVAAKATDPVVAMEPADPAADPAAAEPTYADKATFDFRMVNLDPDTIGTTQRCDVSSVYADDNTDTGPIFVTCTAGTQGSTIAFERTTDTLSTLKALAHQRTQIEVRIDDDGEPGPGDARVSLVRVVGELRPPERPSRCCLRERDRDLDGSRPAPPESWDFKKYERDHQKHWGETHACRISSVGELMRTAADAREYSIGRVFDAETLPYAAKIYCGGTDVVVGARSAHQLLRLARDQVIEIELGWTTRYHHGTTGKLGRTVYTPSDDD